MGLTKPWAIGLVILCTAFTSTGALFLKTGLNRFEPTLAGAINAYPVLIGLFLYFLGFILLTISFRYGELSTLFPFVSLSFIWVALMSYLILGERITLLEACGVGVIVLGVILIGLSSREPKMKGKKPKKGAKKK